MDFTIVVIPGFVQHCPVNLALTHSARKSNLGAS
jgi:hypothetical protein